MRKFFRPSRPTAKGGFAYRFGWFVGRIIVWFLVLSVGFTLLYRFVPPPITLTMIMDPNGFTKDWTSLNAIDRTMVAAVIAGEDGKFCAHNGFDTEAIEQAMERNAKGGLLRGGSTISQQTAKNVFLWQGTGWTRYVRKGLETWFTFLIETGIGTYGVEAGAQRYYKHSAARLTQVEAARIAAALPSPKKRAVAGATGFTRRHGNTIARRSNGIRNSDYDACVYE